METRRVFNKLRLKIIIIHRYFFITNFISYVYIVPGLSCLRILAAKNISVRSGGAPGPSPNGTQFFCFHINFCQKAPASDIVTPTGLAPPNEKSWIRHWILLWLHWSRIDNSHYLHPLMTCCMHIILPWWWQPKWQPFCFRGYPKDFLWCHSNLGCWLAGGIWGLLQRVTCMSVLYIVKLPKACITQGS